MNTDQKIIKNKVGLLNLADMLGSVSEACKVMGYSRTVSIALRNCTRRGRACAEGDQPAQTLREEPNPKRISNRPLWKWPWNSRLTVRFEWRTS